MKTYALDSRVFLKYVAINTIGELCAVIKHARKLRFEEEPNYAYIKELLKSAFTINNFEYDFIFDWISQGTSFRSPSRVISVQCMSDNV